MKGMFKNLSLAVFTIALLTYASTTKASESRADALLYNPAFEDLVDVFMFPQLATEHPSITFYLPAAITNAYGGIIYKTKSGNAFGLFVHRPLASTLDQYRLWALNVAHNTILPGSSAINGAAQNMFYEGGQVFDLMWGNGRIGVGLRLFGQAQAHTNVGTADTVAGNTLFGADLNFGYGISEASNMHAEIGFGHTSNVGTQFTANIGYRYLGKNTASMVNGVMVSELQFGLFSPSTGKSSIYFGIPFKAGARIELIKDKLFAGVLSGLDLQIAKAGGADVAFAAVVPTAEIATEYYVLQWLTLRAAIKGGWGLQFSGASGQHPSTGQMAFNSGLGFNFHDFTIDATISYSLWQNGPYVLGGARGLFGNVSLTYNF